MLSDAINELLCLQSGVIARRQALAAGAQQADLERLLRRREVVRLLPGRLFHDSARQRDLDLDRDLDALIRGSTNSSLGLGQV